MFYFITTIHNLTTTDNLSPFHIGEGSNFEYFLFNPAFLYNYGTLTANDFRNRFCYFSEVLKHGEHFQAELHTENSLVFGKLFTVLWLIKDNAIFNSKALGFTENYEYAGTDSRNLMISKADGTYDSTNFTADEFAKGWERALLLQKHLTSNETGQPAQNGNTMRSALETIEYISLNKMDRCIRYITFARTTSFLLSKISWYIVALESLFSNEDTDISFKLRYRVALFLGGTNSEKSDTVKLINKGYDLRSKYLHGSAFPKNNKKLNDLEYQKDISVGLDNLLRRIIITLISDDAKMEIINNIEKFNQFFHNQFLGITEDDTAQ